MVADAPPLQRKIKALATSETFDTVLAATTKVTDDCTPLAAPLTSGEQYTVKTVNDMKQLALGQEADVLLPRKHVVGEIHNASQFDRISGEWPGVPTMGEGSYTTKEAQPAMAATRGASHTTFETNFQAQGSTLLPLENFHAAAYGRLMAFLLLWNEYKVNKAQNVVDLFKKKVPDFVNLYVAYINVGAGVYSHGMDQSILGIWPSYAGKIEEGYGAMYELLSGSDGKAAFAKVKAIAADIAAVRPIPAISATEFTTVQGLAAAMVPAVTTILKTSMAAKAGANVVNPLAGGVDTYVNANAKTMADAASAAAFDTSNPVREHFMNEQIRTLSKPALVKVGKNHIAGLTTKAIPDATLYLDFTDFDAALRKRATDL